MEQFHANLGEWPFKIPERFEALDGSALDVPEEWELGAGAWGCMLSHRTVLSSAINEGVKSLLVLEDDAKPVPEFSKLAGYFLHRVPTDWECLMFGAEHLQPPTRVMPGIVQCVGAIRCHAYAVRGPMMQILLSYWNAAKSDHCDLILASLMRHFKTYAPEPLLIAQDAGYSDISCRGERLRFISPHHKEQMAAKDPKYSIERLLVRLPKFGEPYMQYVRG
jgi:hypothetical protein